AEAENAPKEESEHSGKSEAKVRLSSASHRSAPLHSLISSFLQFLTLSLPHPFTSSPFHRFIALPPHLFACASVPFPDPQTHSFILTPQPGAEGEGNLYEL